MSAIRRVPKKKRSQAARALRPAPWNYPPEVENRGLRHYTSTWMESEELENSRRLVAPAMKPRPSTDHGVRTGPYKNDLWNGDHLNSAEDWTAHQRTLAKYNPANNLSTEQADMQDNGNKDGRKIPAHQADKAEIPWMTPNPWPRHLETENGKLRGQRHHPEAHLQSDVQIPHNTEVKAKPRRDHGKLLSHEARVMSCFEQGTYVRKHDPVVPAAEHRLRSPYGTALNYTIYEPMRKHTVHYDTRQLLTYC